MILTRRNCRSALIVAGMLCASPQADARVKVLRQETLQSGQKLDSADGRFRLLMQTDCNLVIYKGGKALWNTHTAGRGQNCKLSFQGDSNLVVINGAGKPVWDSGTVDSYGITLVLQDDGNLVMKNPGGKPVWASGSVYTEPKSGATTSSGSKSGSSGGSPSKAPSGPPPETSWPLCITPPKTALQPFPSAYTDTAKGTSAAAAVSNWYKQHPTPQGEYIPTVQPFACKGK